MSIKLTLQENQDFPKQEGIVFLHPDSLRDSSGILVKIKFTRKTFACIALTSEKCNKNSIYSTGTLRKNLHAEIGDVVTVKPFLDPPDAKRIHIISSDASLFDSHIVPHFRGKYRPVTAGEIILIDDVEFKILSTDPQDCICLVVKTTIIHFDADKIKEPNEISYSSIGGCNKELRKIREMVELPLLYPEFFDKIGITPPRGILLYGPPGTGKTLIARVLAHELDVFFIVINGPDIMNKYVGESQSNLRKIFEEAERNKPSIIFIDEIDSIAPKRDKIQNDTDKQVVTQLLTLMDGITGRRQIMVIGATNRLNAIDDSLRRFGRFDHEIKIGIPDSSGRLDILKIHTKNMKIKPDVDLEFLSKQTHGMVGSDLQHVCTEAAMECLRDLSDDFEDLLSHEDITIAKSHFMKALKIVTPSSLRSDFANASIPNVKWSDIGGLQGVKKQLQELIQLPIENPEAFLRFGITPPKGILLYGPPGCGKTLLAKAAANESNVNFIGVKASDLLTMWFGESEANIRELFIKARSAAPCILFFDEIDSIASSRSALSTSNEKVVNQLLAEMDGMNSLQNVFIIAATNRKDLLDPAILRPGRFDQLVKIDFPNAQESLEILRAQLRKAPKDPTFQNPEEYILEKLADSEADIRIGGKVESKIQISGADLTAICQKVCKAAILKKDKFLKKEHIDEFF